MYVSPDANEEKKARAALLSAVERHLTKDNIVILDSMNYIKGYRYQLLCVSKALATTQCTVSECGCQDYSLLCIPSDHCLTIPIFVTGFLHDNA
jgi:tRNA uridine 5-carbamoylmethylation protein Kti12